MNQVCYFEIISNDLAATQAFYGKAFGWQMTPSSECYVMWNPGEGAEGGFQLEPLEQYGRDSNRTLAYVEVEDIDAMLARAEELGGKIVKPKTLISEEYGYYGLCTDPSGTLFGLWSKN